MRQRSLLEFIKAAEGEGGVKCKYCGRAFSTQRGLKVHLARAHSLYSDEDVEVVEVDEGHVQLTVKMRKTLYQDLMRNVERAGVDLCSYLLSALIMGDFLFDKEVQRYIARKAWQEVKAYLRREGQTEESPSYIV
ncbi:MAG: C2H2-type zinc finger protein [Thermofilaceae archaeon]